MQQPASPSFGVLPDVRQAGTRRTDHLLPCDFTPNPRDPPDRSVIRKGHGSSPSGEKAFGGPSYVATVRARTRVTKARAARTQGWPWCSRCRWPRAAGGRSTGRRWAVPVLAGTGFEGCSITTSLRSGGHSNAVSYHMARVDLSGRQVSTVAPGAAPHQQIVPCVQIRQQTFEPGMQCSG
jgi:hypothetical protein